MLERSHVDVHRHFHSSGVTRLISHESTACNAVKACRCSRETAYDSAMHEDSDRWQQ